MTSETPYFTTREAWEGFRKAHPDTRGRIGYVVVPDYFVSESAKAGAIAESPGVAAALELEGAGLLAKAMSDRLAWQEPDWAGKGHTATLEEAADELSAYGVHHTPETLRDAVLTRGRREVFQAKWWFKLANCPAGGVSTWRDLAREMRGSKARLGRKLQEFIDGRVMCPTLYELPGGEFFVVNGGIRLAVAHAFGVIPAVWCVAHAESKEFNENQARDENGRWAGGMAVMAAAATRGVQAFRSVGHTAGHLEHVASAFVTDGIPAAIERLPASVRPAVKALWFVTKLGTKAAFATYTAGQSLAERVSAARGATPEQAARLRGICTALDLVGAKAGPLSLSACGLGGLAVASSFMPLGSAAYLAYSTAVNPAAVFKAAASAVKDLVSRRGKEMDPQSLADRLDTALALAGDRADWFHALFLAALEETGDAEAALSIAAEISSERGAP